MAGLDRREFISGAAGAALALTLPGQAGAGIQAESSALSPQAVRALRGAAVDPRTGL